MKSYYDDKRSEARRRDAIMTEAVAIIHAYESECLCHIRADLSGKFGCERCKRARAFLAKLEESDYAVCAAVTAGRGCNSRQSRSRSKWYVRRVRRTRRKDDE